MPEIDIERKIEKYYGRIDRLLSDEDRELLDSILDGIEKYFIDPAKNNPVKAVEFASWLDPEPIVDLLNTSKRDLGQELDSLLILCYPRKRISGRHIIVYLRKNS